DRSVEATSRVSLDCSLAKRVAALEELEGISDDACGKALEKIISPDWREVFIAMSNERKRAWVLRL
ncbi:F-box protein, partial [Trifolium medium]|nr:F-box protein [Trifolium medium]